MNEYTIGYDCADPWKLVEYKTKDEAVYNSEEWVIVYANSLEEAKDKYECAFIEWQKKK